MRRAVVILASVAIGVGIILWFTRRANAAPSNVAAPDFKPIQWNEEKFKTITGTITNPDTGEQIELTRRPYKKSFAAAQAGISGMVEAPPPPFGEAPPPVPTNVWQASPPAALPPPVNTLTFTPTTASTVPLYKTSTLKPIFKGLN